MKLGYFEKGFIPEDQFDYAVVGARYQDKWIIVRHKERETWEIPGGHKEVDESVEEAAKRELREETGAEDFAIYSILDYTVTMEGKTTYGRLFYAAVTTLGTLSPEVEIAELKLVTHLPENLTYPLIQPHLHKMLEKFQKEL